MGIKQKFTHGFTIIELLIVITVIGILAGITAVIYNGVQSSARDTSVLSDLDTMDGLQTNYSLKHNGNAKPYYSGNGPDAELDFAPSGDNVIDVVTNGDDYCIRGYNTKGTKTTIDTAFTKESTTGVCDITPPSIAAGGNDSSLVGWWKFDGNADDSSGNGNNGTVLNANLAIGQNGQPDNAYVFNGTSAYIYKDGGSTLSFSDNFTISAWVKPTAYHTTGYYGLMNGILARGPATTYNYALQLTDATTVSFIKRTGSESLQFYHYTGVPTMTNIWTHLLVEIQGTTAVLYVNGTLFGTKTIGAIAPGGSDKLYIGGVTTSGDPLFIGSIDDVRIFSRTLSSYEVQSIYNAGAQ